MVGIKQTESQGELEGGDRYVHNMINTYDDKYMGLSMMIS